MAQTQARTQSTEPAAAQQMDTRIAQALCSSDDEAHPWTPHCLTPDECDAAGRPATFILADEKRPVPVAAVLDHFREWIGVLGGEPERDVWQVEIMRGVCELHHLRHPTEDVNDPAGGDWLLFRWED